MRREFANTIRFLMDECLPPVIRDSRWFMWPFYWIAYRGHEVGAAMDFKRRVGSMSPAEYEAFYRGLRSISRDRDTDLNAACLEAVIEAIPADARLVVDVGCGNGFLLRQLRARRGDLLLKGFDILDKYPDIPGVEFAKAAGTSLPLDDRSVDVTTCCHVLEHVVDPRRAVLEMLRVTRRKLVIVVPCQRAFRYTLDEHVNFFLYPEALTDLVGLRRFTCRKLGGDWFYEGEVP
jgi:SAM-dependent methyltransferase